MKIKKYILLLITEILFAVTMFGMTQHVGIVEAVAVHEEEQPVAELQGLYVDLSLTLTNEGDMICAIAKNEFTLFPSTVRVIVELYSSEEYYDLYADMTLESRNTISDLNIGKSISASSSTDGRQLWWRARMRYKKDNDDWKEVITNAYLYDKDGNLLF